jgi:hypothetical protein
MNIRPFFYLRMPHVALGGAWEHAKEYYTWGGFLFPDSAIQLKCTEDGGQIEIQESRDPHSIKTITFNHGAHVVILNNSLIFFEGEMKGYTNKSLDDT